MFVVCCFLFDSSGLHFVWWLLASGGFVRFKLCGFVCVCLCLFIVGDVAVVVLLVVAFVFCLGWLICCGVLG